MRLFGFLRVARLPSVVLACPALPPGLPTVPAPIPQWISRISDLHLFDQGWNALREQIFAHQKRLGVISAGARLPPWPHDLLKNRDELTDVEKRLFIRRADVHAAYLAYTDHEIS